MTGQPLSPEKFARLKVELLRAYRGGFVRRAKLLAAVAHEVCSEEQQQELVALIEAEAPAKT